MAAHLVLLVRQNDGQLRTMTDTECCNQLSMAKLIEQAGFRRAINDRARCGVIRSGVRPAGVHGGCVGRGYPTPRVHWGRVAEKRPGPDNPV